MKVEKQNRLPEGSILNYDNGMYDFVETYYIKRSKEIGLNAFITSFFKSIPKWLMWMLNIRIKKDMVDGSKLCYSEGDMIGPFHLFRLINNEIVLGINMKHLDYRISLLIEGTDSYRLCYSTIFTINNFLTPAFA